VPGQVFVGLGEHQADEARSFRIDVPVGAHEALRDRADALDDALDPRLTAYGMRLHRASKADCSLTCMPKPTVEEMWREMLTGDYPRFHRMRKMWGALPSPPRCKLCKRTVSRPGREPDRRPRQRRPRLRLSYLPRSQLCWFCALGLARKPPRLEPSSTVTFGLGAPGSSPRAFQSNGGASVLASGTVKWFNQENGYGYIVADVSGVDLFVHRGSIMGDDWRDRTLLEGARVGFDVREGGLFPEAIHVLPMAAKGSP
jgi:CspA family cold shock protein